MRWRAESTGLRFSLSAFARDKDAS
uniref:Uncharacterized protein n=1 Tax=Rhizophora mucronata TaxID=61149 RepID=A0A2P2LH06_RHIMU